MPERKEPYWTVISKGCAVGYRRGSKGGTWVARLRDDIGRQHYGALGAADDHRDPDGLSVFSFAQAQELARTFFERRVRELTGHLEPQTGPYRVSDALADYFDAREGRGSKGVRADRYAASARIVPALGKIDLVKLTTRHIRDWHSGLANSPKMLRTGRNATERNSAAVDSHDPEAVRSRRATANRVLTVLKAALNHAFHEGRIGSDAVWRKVKPFRGADTPVIRYLTPDEGCRLVEACEPSFRKLVRAALLTGCRYGELTRLVKSDYNGDAGTICIRISKSDKPRHVVLCEEGQSLFSDLTKETDRRDRIFVRPDGKPWGVSHQQRPLESAGTHAGIAPAASFHVLRHTYASTLAMRGVPMGVIAKQLGHSDTRMTERHYAHLAPSYVAEQIRSALAMGEQPARL